MKSRNKYRRHKAPSGDNEPPTSSRMIEKDDAAAVDGSIKNRGTLILDATVAPQAIRYPVIVHIINV